MTIAAVRVTQLPCRGPQAFALARRATSTTIGRGCFTRPTCRKKRWFEHYSRTFDTVEVNNTFYRLPPASVFDKWRHETPPGFCFALKFSRFGTHIKRLKDPQEPVARFLESSQPLGPHRGPILVQLPPQWKPNVERLEAFLQCAPRLLQWAVEIRDERWLCDEVFDVLRRHGAALCFHDMIADHPRVVTAGFVYLRYHGVRYNGTYDTALLRAEADRIRDYCEAGLDVYAYFNNDLGGHAIHNALELRELVSGPD